MCEAIFRSPAIPGLDRLQAIGPDNNHAEGYASPDVSAVHDAKTRVLAVFALNRRLIEALKMVALLQGPIGHAQVIDHQLMTHAKGNAAHLSANPMAAPPQRGRAASTNRHSLTGKLPQLSFQMLRIKPGRTAKGTPTATLTANFNKICFILAKILHGGVGV